MMGQFGPFPAWAQSDLAFQMPSGVSWEAPEWQSVDPRLAPVPRHETRGVHFESYEFGMRSSKGTIAIWEWIDSPLRRVELGGINSGLDRLMYLGVSTPGAIFPGASAVLVWTGFTSSSQIAVCGLPLYANKVPDPSNVVLSPIPGVTGAAWVCASIVDNGVAILDGVSGNFCWLEHGQSLHPEIVVGFNSSLRTPIQRIILNDSGQFELLPYRVGVANHRLVLGAGGVMATEPNELPPLFVAGASAGAERLPILGTGGMNCFVEARPTPASEWCLLAVGIFINSSDLVVPARLSRALLMGEEIRVVDSVGLAMFGPVVVEAASPMIFSVVPASGNALKPGGSAIIHGENFTLSGVGSPSLSIINQIAPITATAKTIAFVLPSDLTPGEWPLSVFVGGMMDTARISIE